MIRAIIVFVLLMFDLTMKGQTSELEKRIFQMDDLAVSLYKNCKFNDAINVTTKILNICDSANITDGNTFAIVLSHHANNNAALGRYNQAIEYGLRSYEIRKRLLETNEEDTTYLVNYAMSLFNVASYYDIIHKVDEAFYFAWEAERLRFRLITNGYDNTLAGREIYASTLEILANCYIYCHDYDKAIEAENEAIVIRKHYWGEESAQFAGSLCFMAKIYSAQGNYEDALTYEHKALAIREKTLGLKHKDYSSSLAHIAAYNYYMGDYKNAIRYAIRGLNIDKEIYGELHPNYASKLDNMALYLYNMHDTNTAIEYEERALNIREKNDSTSYDYAVSLSNMAMFQNRKGNTKEAINYSNRALKITERVFGNNSYQYATILSNMCNYFAGIGDIKKAILLGEQVLKIRKGVLDSSHHDIAISYRNLANYYRTNRQYENAIEYDSIMLQMYDMRSIDYANALYKLSVDYYCLCDTNNAIQYFEQSMDAFSNYIQTTFGLLTSREREMAWNFIGHLFQEDLLYLSYKLGINKAEDIYNMTALFAKGFLLNTEKEQKKNIQNANNNTIQSLFRRYQKNQTMLNLDYDRNSLSRDSILKDVYIIEDSLTALYPQWKELLYNRYTWQDIQRCLQHNDIAIEFVKCSEDSVDLYHALVLKSVGVPQLIYICSSNDITQKDERTTSHIIWQSLKPYLEDVYNIYFSPIGIINNIALEYYPLDSSYNIYRLSSSKELTKNRAPHHYSNAVLFGGLDYEPINNNIHDEVHVNTNLPKSDNISGYLKMRSGFDRLNKTKDEVLEICKLMNSQDILTHAYYNDSGTEEAFYKTPTIQPEIIHLSTHGMYVAQDEIIRRKKENNLTFIREDKDQDIQEDISLTRSFLVMSGGNMLARREEVPKGMEDGILTAQEISQMDLQTVDLVVLSACQSGLGDLNNEGIYGLQRGFKKAGVNTILMSLNKVDDDATRILMVEFYRNLINGKTKRQSLQEAQQYLRKVENGKYDDPKYWASFIMLDGLN